MKLQIVQRKLFIYQAVPPTYCQRNYSSWSKQKGGCVNSQDVYNSKNIDI